MPEAGMTPETINELIGTIEICRKHKLPLNDEECKWITRALLELHEIRTTRPTSKTCESQAVRIAVERTPDGQNNS